jgi:SAM-dependent methyltransferase
MAETDPRYDGDIPRDYDRYLGPVLFEPYADDLADRLPADSPGDVLELACGTGILTRRLRELLAPTARVVATDVSQPMLDFARNKLAPSDRVEWRQADAAALPFPDAGFDVVVCQFGLMFFPDKVAAMSEARRVLSPGGWFVFNVWDSLAENDLSRVAGQVIKVCFPDGPPEFLKVPYGYHEPDVIAADLARAGFLDVTVTRVVRKTEGASARDFATGVVMGTPAKHLLREHTDLNELIETLATRIGHECGDPTRAARMSALVVTARRGDG